MQPGIQTAMVLRLWCVLDLVFFTFSKNQQELGEKTTIAIDNALVKYKTEKNRKYSVRNML